MRCRISNVVSVGLLVALVGLPALASVAWAFRSAEGGWTLANVVDVWGEWLWWRLLGKSIALSAAAAAVASMLGVPYAWLVTSTNLRGRRIWEVLGIAGIVVPSYSMAMAWLNLIGGAGVVRRILPEGMPFAGNGLGIVGPIGTVGILAASYLPFVVLFASAGFRLVGEDAVDAARADGASVWTLLRRIRLPGAMPGVLLGAGAVFAFCLSDSEIAVMLGVDTISREALDYLARMNPRGPAMAAAPTIVIVALAGVYAAWAGPSWNRAALSSGRGTARDALGWWGLAASAFCAFVVMVTLGVPVFGLVAGVGSVGHMTSACQAASGPLAVTLGVAFCAAAMAGAAGIVLGRCVARSRGAGRLGGVTVAALPLAVPAAALGLGMMVFWRSVGMGWLLTNWTGLAAGLAVRFLPFAVFGGAMGAAAVPPELEDAARADGAGPWTIAFRIYLPLAAPASGGGLFVVFALACCELQVSQLLAPPGIQTLSGYLAGRIHVGEVERVSAVALLMLAVSAGAASAGLWLLRRRGAQS